MPVDRQTFRAVKVLCQTCGARTKPLVWTHAPLGLCPCGGALVAEIDPVGRAHAVLGDEIDRTIEHGLCHADGTPRRFRSRQELHQAERAAGYRILERGERFPGDARRAARAEQTRGRA